MSAPKTFGASASETDGPNFVHVFKHEFLKIPPEYRGAPLCEDRPGGLNANLVRLLGRPRPAVSRALFDALPPEARCPDCVAKRESIAKLVAQHPPQPAATGPRWYAAKDFDEECSPVGPFATREEAAKAIILEHELFDGESFQTALAAPCAAPDPFCHGVGSVLEDLSEMAEAPEAFDEWPEVDDAEAEDLRASLSKAVADWFERHPNLKPNWWEPAQVQDHVVAVGEGRPNDGGT